MTFLNPWLLLGIAGIASPIIIHLLARKQIKRVVWAAMRFLTATVERNKRKMTLEDILLLVLRCLVIALFAFALARPSLRSKSLGTLGASETAILLIDESGSMSTSDGAITRFEKAQKAAEDIIDALPSGSSIAVWFVSDRVRDVIPEPTRDLALARKTIRDGKRTDQATQWTSALRKALDVLARQPGSAKQLYVLTDAQANGWANLSEARQMLESAQREAQTRLVLVTEGETRNLGITSARLASAMTASGQPARFEIGVANFGTEEMRDVAVSLAVNEEAPSEEQTIESLPPSGEPRIVSLFATFRNPGFHSVTARIRADRCTFDDTRSLAVHVAGNLDVLLVDGQPGLEPRDGEVFYLQNALTPVPPELRESYFIKPKRITTSELPSVSLPDFEAVVLANVVDLAAAEAATLEAYVRNGGGLMVFPGSRVNTAFYNDSLHARAGLLPAAFGEIRGESVDETKAERPQAFFTLQGKGYQHRVTTPWTDPKNGDLTSAQFYRAFTLVPGKANGSGAPPAVVLAFADGAPAIMEKAVGSGRVLQFASTADTAWNDVAIRPVFVPLMHRALGYLLASHEDRVNTRVGSPFSYTLAREFAGKEARVIAPGQTRETASARRIELKDQAATFRHEATEMAGVFRVQAGDDVAGAFRFATQSDPAESALRELPFNELDSLAQVAAVIRWQPGIDLRGAIKRERTGAELWLPFVLAVLGLAVAETIFGNRWSRSR